MSENFASQGQCPGRRPVNLRLQEKAQALIQESDDNKRSIEHLQREQGKIYATQDIIWEKLEEIESELFDMFDIRCPLRIEGEKTLKNLELAFHKRFKLLQPFWKVEVQHGHDTHGNYIIVNITHINGEYLDHHIDLNYFLQEMRKFYEIKQGKVYQIKTD